LCLLRKNDEAFAELELSIELNPSFAQAFIAQGFNVLWAGRIQRKPNYTGALARQEFFFCKEKGFIDRFVGGLRLAGIPGS